ncbi:DUF547 domain-containing protein [Synechococcus sp. CS-1332]|uniref:DUF547 domain-containing protein n=1 Tax=Synechococcus sp. CS-1332 TaxID=2847972 RepID=UPI00223B45D1|nr:DUF547 domain-containing protein [Synechococcus sp. CS-1332]MCT0207241.1 DUF547 domain-containing protein [Synechococcus sp. CS-1332]
MVPVRSRTPLLLVCGLVLIAATGCGGGSAALMGREGSRPSLAAVAPQASLDPAPFNAVLQNVVDGRGLVDYAALQRDPAQLDRYIKALGALAPERFASWSEVEQIALLINAYNAFTLRSIIDHDPIRPSIKAIPGVWKFRRHQLMGRSLTLDAIEHEILRKDYNEPRIHAALVCAAISCPPLRREAFTGPALDRQLEDQTTRWLASPVGLTIDRAAGTVRISSIFQWFAEDWQRADPTAAAVPGHQKQSAVLRFIARHRPAEERALILGGDYRFSYLPYNWDLNRQSP